MKLYHSATSPYVRKVMIVLHMTGLIERTELVSGGGTPLDPNDATLGANPLGKVPCLVTDDGETLFDSRVITRYLDHLARAGLYPEPPALFRVLTLEALADGVTDAGLLAVYEWRLRPEEIRYRPWVEAQEGKIVRGIARLEAMTDELLGATTAGHVAAGAALGYLDFRFPHLGWRDTAPDLASWYETFAARPFMQATRPET